MRESKSTEENQHVDADRGPVHANVPVIPDLEQPYEDVETTSGTMASSMYEGLDGSQVRQQDTLYQNLQMYPAGIKR